MNASALISSARYELDANPNRAWQPEDVAQLLEAAEHVQGELNNLWASLDAFGITLRELGFDMETLG